MSARQDDLLPRLDWSLVPISLAVLGLCLMYTFAQAFWAIDSGFTINGGWMVIHVDSCKRYPAWCENNPGRLYVGDEIVEIGGVTREEYLNDKTLLLYRGYQRGDLVPITVRRARGLETIQWRLPGLSGKAQVVALVGLLFYGPFWLAGTTVLLFLRPRGVQWLLLVLVNFVTAVWLATGIVSFARVAAASLVMHALAWLLIPLYWHLHMLVPTPLFRRRPRWLVPALYMGAAVISAIELFQEVSQSAYMLGPLLAMVGSLGLLLYRLFDRASGSAHRATYLMLAGIGLSMGPGLVLGVVGSLIDPTVTQAATISAALLAVPILPLSYTYAIYRRRVGGLEFRAHRLFSTYAFALVYGTTFALALLLGNRLLATDELDPVEFAGRSLVLNVVISMAFVLASADLRGRFQRAVGRAIYGTEYDADDIVHYFAPRIAAAVDRGTLSHILTYQLAPSLLVRQWALYLLEQGEPALLCGQGIAPDGGLSTRDEAERLLVRGSRYWPPVAEMPAALDWVRVVISLRAGQDEIGLWLFGARDPDDFYPLDDIRLLNTLASQVAVAIRNIQLHEQAQREIEERKRAEVSLRQERDRSQQYLDVAGVIILALDREGNIQMVNRRGHEILGYDRRELEGRNWFEMCLPERARAEVRALFRDLLSGNANVSQIHREPVLTRSGEERLIVWRNALIRDDTGAIVGTLSSGEDVTDYVGLSALSPGASSEQRIGSLGAPRARGQVDAQDHRETR